MDHLAARMRAKGIPVRVLPYEEACPPGHSPLLVADVKVTHANVNGLHELTADTGGTATVFCPAGRIPEVVMDRFMRNISQDVRALERVNTITYQQHSGHFTVFFVTTPEDEEKDEDTDMDTNAAVDALIASMETARARINQVEMEMARGQPPTKPGYMNNAMARELALANEQIGHIKKAICCAKGAHWKLSESGYCKFCKSY